MRLYSRRWTCTTITHRRNETISRSIRVQPKMKNVEKSKSRKERNRNEREEKKNVEKNTRQEKKHYDVELNIHFKWPRGKLLHFRRHRCTRQSFSSFFFYVVTDVVGNSTSSTSAFGYQVRLPNPTEIILLKWIRVCMSNGHTLFAHINLYILQKLNCIFVYIISNGDRYPYPERKREREEQKTVFSRARKLAFSKSTGIVGVVMPGATI